MDLPNPYDAPKATDISAPSTEPYKSANGLAGLLKALLWASLASTALMLFTEINQLELLGRIATGDFTQEEADLNDSSVTTVALVFLVVLSTTGVCFCAWFARCNRNARALGAEAMQFGPRAWGWFFCPILNLWKPYQAVTELFVSSQDVRRAIMPTAVFTAWWAAWVTSGISGRVSTKMMESDAIGTVTAGAWLGALSSVAILAAGFFCIRVVSSIQNEQNLRIEP